MKEEEEKGKVDDKGGCNTFNDDDDVNDDDDDVDSSDDYKDDGDGDDVDEDDNEDDGNGDGDGGGDSDDDDEEEMEKEEEKGKVDDKGSSNTFNGDDDVNDDDDGGDEVDEEAKNNSNFDADVVNGECGDVEVDNNVEVDDFNIFLSFDASLIRAVTDCKVRSIDDGTCKNISAVEEDIPICQRLAVDGGAWKFSLGLISVDIAELTRGVSNFAMKLLLPTLSVVDDENLTLGEEDRSFSGRSVVGETTENDAIEGCSVECNSA